MLGLNWIVVAIVVPMYATAAVALGRVDPILLVPRPEWNPAAWQTSDLFAVLRDLFGGGLGKVWLRTTAFVLAATAISILVGYPVAYFLARFSGRRRGLYLALVLAPLWIPFMMRMLAWVGLLERDGLVNRLLSWVGISPIAWLSGRPEVVVLGLVYGYIPFFILPLFATLDQVPESTLEAGKDLGASPWQTFLRVTLPQSRPGLLAGAALISLPMFGDFFTTNMLSGSPSTRMIGNEVDFYINQARMGGARGAAITLILVVFTALLLVYYLRQLARSSRERPLPSVERAATTAGPVARLLRLWTWVYMLWALIPAALAVLFSFNAGRSRSFWQGASLRWYLSDDSVFNNPALRNALAQTLRLATATTILTVPLGLGLALGVTRWRGRVRTWGNFLVLVPLVIPELVLAVGLFFAVSELYRFLPFGTDAQVFGHVAFVLPVVVVILQARLLALGTSFEETAMDLGASPSGAIRRVLVPLLAPALVAAAAFSLVISMDDFVLSQFLSGGESSITVPMRLYVAARSLSTPAINALATLMLFANGCILAAAWIGLRAYRRRGLSATDSRQVLRLATG